MKPLIEGIRQVHEKSIKNLYLMRLFLVQHKSAFLYLNSLISLTRHMIIYKI